MARRIEQRLGELGIELPQPSAPGANYVPFVRIGDLVLVTGQLSQWNGERRFVGKLGREYDVADGQHAAQLCALNVVAHLRQALTAISTGSNGACGLAARRDPGLPRPLAGRQRRLRSSSGCSRRPHRGRVAGARSRAPRAGRGQAESRRRVGRCGAIL